MSSLLKSFLFILALYLSQFALANDQPVIKSNGIPPIVKYGLADHQLSNINFNVLEGNDGRIYFGNYKGVLVFDGVNWTSVTLPNEGAVYGLAKSSSGKIYVGAINEIGYLTAAPDGQLMYQSLLDSIGGFGEGFTARVYTMAHKIVFTMRHQTVIMDNNGGKTLIIPNPESSTTIQKSGEKLYAFSPEGIFRLQDNHWEWVRKSAIVNSATRYDCRLVDTPGGTLAITTNGFFDFNTEQKLSISPAIEAFLRDIRIVSIELLADQYLAISSFKGLMITDLSGNAIQFLNKDRGLPENFVFRTCLDHSGMLWVVTYNGIAAVNVFSPVTIYDSRLGVNGVLKDVQLIDEQIYLCTMSGIYRGEWSTFNDPLSTPSLQKISSVTAHGMIRADNTSIVFTERESNIVIENGIVYEIEGTRQNIYWSGLKYQGIEEVLLGSYEGDLLHVVKQEGRWRVQKKLDPIFLATECMVQGTGDDIWVSSINEGVFRISFDREKSKLGDQVKYGLADGLPSDLNNFVFVGVEGPLFATNEGIYVYDRDLDRFKPSPAFADLVINSPVYLIAQHNEDYTHYYTDAFRTIKKTPSGYELIEYPLVNFIDFPPERITVLDDQNVLLSSAEAFLHINPEQYQPVSNFGVNITSLVSLTHDSLFFGGFGDLPETILLPHEERSLRIKFASTSFVNTPGNQYKWRLRGFENEWSAWSHETQKDYTNLPSGRFTFEVICKNAFGKQGDPAYVQIKIGRAWYNTYGAYALYVMIFVSVVWGVVVIYTRKLRTDKDRLEKIVEDRTKEIKAQKEQVEDNAAIILDQRNKLVQMDELKSRFFVNISHELRTPLTLTLGTLELSLKGGYGPLADELRANLRVSYRNSERLMKMVNNILDISKLERGKMQLFAIPAYPEELINKVILFFAGRFEEKQITLKTLFASQKEIYLDQDKFDTIFINLLANAFKFTPAGGSITVKIEDVNDAVQISVEDTGEGILPADVPFVFDRFYQSHHIKSGEGLGVGLALTKELVELHGGSISVQSTPGVSTVFTVTFLHGSKHLTPEQIAANPPQEVKALADKYLLNDDFGRHKKEITNLPKKADASRPLILVVEDNPDMANFIKGLLLEDFDVINAPDGHAGISILEKQIPDLIITDYLMPEMDGYEMTTRIKQNENWSMIPVIFLTARAKEEDKIAVLNLGVDDYLYKPFNTIELRVRINNLLTNKHKRKLFIQKESIDPRDIEWKEFPSKLKIMVDQYISQHIMEEITADTLVAATGLSERSLYRKIRVNTGLTIMGYIKEFRLRKARKMLESQEFLTVSEVSHAVGYKYLSHFTKQYTERFGKNPSEYL